MTEIRKYVAGAALAASLAASGSRAEEPLPPLVGIVEDTADRTIPGCDVTSIFNANTMQPEFYGQFSVSHGRADARAASLSPDRKVHNAILGRMNSKNTVLTGVVVINDRSSGVSATEHFMDIEDRVPFAGAVVVLKADGESGGVYAAATINANAYTENLPGKPIIQNPQMNEGYQLSIYREQVDGVTSQHSLDIAGPDAVFDTGSLLISRMIYDGGSSEITALAYDKSCQDGASCKDKPYFIIYTVNEDGLGYSLTEKLRTEIIAKDNPYDDVASERTGALVQLDYSTYAFTNGLPEIILINRDTGAQTSTTANFESEIRSLAIDQQSGLLVIVCADVVHTARLNSGSIEVIDSIDNPSSKPSVETGGTADIVFRDGVAFVPTSNGDADMRRLEIDSKGRFLSNKEFIVCADDILDDANIISSIFPFDGVNVFHKPTPTDTPTIVFSATPTETATSTPTPTATRYPTGTPILIEETPTRPRPTIAMSTRTPEPYKKDVYVPMLIQRGRQPRR